MLFIVNIWRRGWTLPILGVGLWALIAVVAGAIYPQVIQRLQVAPNEPEKEAPYIERNIEATQEAMGFSVARDRGPAVRPRDRQGRHRPGRQPADGPEHPDLGPFGGGAGQDLPPAAAGAGLLPDQRRRRRPLRAQRSAHPGRHLGARPQHRQRPPRHVDGQAPHLHPRLRRRGGAGQRQGDDRRARVRRAGTCPTWPRRRSSSWSSRRSTSGRTSRGTSWSAPASRSSATRTTRARSSRPTPGPTACRSTTPSRKPPSRCGSATSTR